MGGQGSGRKPDPMKKMLEFNQPTPQYDDTFIMPNTSAVRDEALKTSSEDIKSNWTLTGTDIYNSNSGNVGIGTVSPDYPLHVVGTTASQIVQFEGTGTSNTYIGIADSGVKEWNIGMDNADTSLYIREDNAGGTIAMEIQADSDVVFPNGNVGIGTTSPDFKLQVDGDIASETTGTDSIGSLAIRWLKGWFNSLDVLGNVLIDGDLNVTGKISNSLAHMVGYVTVDHLVASADTWYNLTFNDNLGDIEGIVFENNRTVIILHDGHYTITFGMGFQDSSPSPNANVGMRITLNGTELIGSYVEEDTTKQNADAWEEHTTHAVLNEGDWLNMQYISSDTDVTINQSDTYAVQGFNAYGYIQEVII